MGGRRARVLASVEKRIDLVGRKQVSMASGSHVTKVGRVEIEAVGREAEAAHAWVDKQALVQA